MAAHDAPAPHAAGLAHQFEDVVQQREAGSLGMWIFLATEIMFFGGMFCAYTVYRHAYPQAFEYASSHLLEWQFGATNTVVLICSSLTMVLAIYAAQNGKKPALQVFFLVLTILLGLAFLGIKFTFEWYHDWVEHVVPGFHWQVRPEWGPLAPEVQLFMCFYFFMTGLHALHMIIGVGIMLVISWMAWKGRFTPEYHNPLEISGLYWHFVDIIWIFLFPLLYLLGASEAVRGGG
jgi:cytochrome c oxidase subunit 3